MVQCLALALLATAPMPLATGAPNPEPAQRLLVLDVKASLGMDSDELKILNDLILSEFQRAPALQVMGHTDVVSLLTIEQQRQMIGCGDDACMAEIGGALGARLIASSSVGALGDRFILNLKIINAQEARVLASASFDIEKDDLALAARATVRSVLDQIGVDMVAANTDLDDTAFYETWWFWTITGVVVAGATTGIVLGTTGATESASGGVGTASFSFTLPPAP